MKRGGALSRRSPMRRTRMRRRFRSTKYSRRERDFPRMGWIAQQPCAVPSDPGWPGPPRDACARGVQVHHAGVRGISQRAPDNTSIPLCDHHHDCLTDRCGIFGGWPRGEVKVWELGRIEHYQRAYAARGEVAA